MEVEKSKVITKEKIGGLFGSIVLLVQTRFKPIASIDMNDDEIEVDTKVHRCDLKVNDPVEVIYQALNRIGVLGQACASCHRKWKCEAYNVFLVNKHSL